MGGLCQFPEDWGGSWPLAENFVWHLAGSLVAARSLLLRERGPRFCRWGLPFPFPLPSAGASCGDEPDAGEAEEGLFTYVFRPSQHTRSRQVTSAQLWFHTGLDRQETTATNSSEPLLGLLVLTSRGPTPVPMSLGQAPPRWAVLHLATSAFPLLTHPVLALLLRCPLCSCSARPEATPFLVAHTRAKPPSGGERARRSTPPLPWPWSPAALRLLQRPPEEPAAHADCHRAALNISFQELGWDRWIVHPPSFIFHYCHGGCGLSTLQDLPLPVPGVPPTPFQPLSLVTALLSSKTLFWNLQRLNFWPTTYICFPLLESICQCR